MNQNSEVAAVIALGSTGHWPVPSGDPPLGTGKPSALFRVPVSVPTSALVPSGQWPHGTGGSPVLPLPTSEFGFKSGEAVLEGMLVLVRDLGWSWCWRNCCGGSGS